MMLEKLEPASLVGEHLRQNPLKFLPERAIIEFTPPDVELHAWEAESDEFVLSYARPGQWHYLVTDLTHHGTMKAFVETCPYGVGSVFVFLKDLGWMLDFYRFDLLSMEIGSSVIAGGAPGGGARTESAGGLDVTEIEGQPEGLGELMPVLAPERHLWDHRVAAARRHFVYHDGSELLGYLCVRKWFESYWDAETVTMSAKAAPRVLAGAMLASAAGAVGDGEEAVISLIPDTQERFLKVALKAGWKKFREEYHVARAILP